MIFEVMFPMMSKTGSFILKIKIFAAGLITFSIIQTVNGADPISREDLRQLINLTEAVEAQIGVTRVTGGQGNKYSKEVLPASSLQPMMIVSSAPIDLSVDGEVKFLNSANLSSCAKATTSHGTDVQEIGIYAYLTMIQPSADGSLTVTMKSVPAKREHRGIPMGEYLDVDYYVPLAQMNLSYSRERLAAVVKDAKAEGGPSVRIVGFKSLEVRNGKLFGEQYIYDVEGDIPTDFDRRMLVQGVQNSGVSRSDISTGLSGSEGFAIYDGKVSRRIMYVNANRFNYLPLTTQYLNAGSEEGVNFSRVLKEALATKPIESPDFELCPIESATAEAMIGIKTNPVRASAEEGAGNAAAGFGPG